MERQQKLYADALNEVRKAILTMDPDDLLVSYIYRVLARAVSQAYDLPSPEEYIPSR